MSHGLGRRHASDERDRLHLMTAKLPAVVGARPAKKTWRLDWKGDQGATSQCVGYGWHGLLRALPHLQRDPRPDLIYQAAQKMDEWPGEDYDGTSVRGGAKALKAAGKLLAYSWAFDVETVLDWLGRHGPVVLGTNWYQDMFAPSASGKVEPSGALAGGHCYVAIGYDDKAKLLLCQNSWGKAWGVKGRFNMSYGDADQLIKEDGEACAPTES